MPVPVIRVLPDPPAIAAEAARRIEQSARAALRTGDRFSLVLSGGKTPESLYQVLGLEPYRSALPWDSMDFYFGDERCVPPDHLDSNYRTAKLALFDRAPIPADHIHRIRGEIDPNASAIEYGKMLKSRFGDEGPDMVLLGMGADGHTASLFPHTEALKETHHRCVANFVPNLSSWRVTMTAPFLNRAKEVLVLASGADKAQRISEVLEADRDPERLPIQLIDPPAGQVTWLLDVAAAGMG